MTPERGSGPVSAEPQEKQPPESWSDHFSPTTNAPLTLASIRERIARAVYPEGFYNEDASREIDRLIVLVESRGGRV